ncbi:unnamed protein product [Symbiodinium natans]|uniref:Uncharacterized protein n=1 Tax=Symbiodinium natans TaxID=878477 RepID=A0A812L5P5_9DINO|nr:unnamed protein product [Symbiodinium natans]
MDVSPNVVPMTDKNHDAPADLPVLLGQKELEVAPQTCSEANASKHDTESKKGGGCPWQIPLVGWFQMLYATFGSFMPLAMLSYGLQQSFARNSQDFACKYYMMDELKLDGATIGRLHTAALMPWNLKTVLGMLSDSVPLFGFHRTSYLVIMCSLCILMYLWIGFFALSTSALLVCMTCINLGIAMSDLVLDATAAGLAKQHPAEACDLTTSFRVSQALCGMASSGLKGVLVASIGPRSTVMSNIPCSFAVLFPALRRWLPEERLPAACCSFKPEKLSRNSNLAAAAIFLAIVAVALSLTQIFMQDWRARATVICCCGILVLWISYSGLRSISSCLSNTASLLFLRTFLQPGLGESMFVWMSKADNGPKFTPQLLGMADCFGFVGLFLGVLFFNRFLRRWKYRSIFLLGQSLLIVSQFLDLILVMRWNKVLGVPDLLFYLGDETFDQAVTKTLYLPLAVLAYKVCPSNLEATMFAMLMTTQHIGMDCGKYLGVALAEFWGIVDGNFDYLPHGVISKAVIRLLSLPFIVILAPTVTPDDPIDSSSHHQGAQARDSSQHN